MGIISKILLSEILQTTKIPYKILRKLLAQHQAYAMTHQLVLRC